jgi:hypothetical protein
VDLLLVSPPVANFGQCSSGISVLNAYLRARGYDVHAWDLAIDAFHAFHSEAHLATLLDGVADEELVALAHKTASEIGEAKQALRTPGIELDHDRMRSAFRTIGDAGKVLTAAGRGKYTHDFRNFSVPKAFASWGAMGLVVDDRELNPYLAFFEQHAIPRLRRDAPKVLGISITYFSQVLPAITLARLVRRAFPEMKIFVGGAYLTSVDHEIEHIPASVLPADAIVLHDGEIPLERLLAWAIRGEGTLADVPGCHAPAANGRFAITSSDAVPQIDLASLPIPMWTSAGLDLSAYLVPKYPIPLPLSRGCYWGRCVYCNISSQSSASYRVRPVEMAVADIKAAMKETGSNWFDFPVDSFRPRELLELCRALKRDGVEIEWGAEVILDRNFRDDILKEIAEGGCRCLRFGLESASAETLKEMNKPIRPAEALQIFRSCKKYGIQTAAMLIAGFPSEPQARLHETFDFLVEAADSIDFVTIHQFSVVPGSVMAQRPGDFGLHLLPVEGILRSNLPFASSNPVGMRNSDLPRVIDTMLEGLQEYYPDLGELWKVAIGGWMTFPACCARRAPSTTSVGATGPAPTASA